MPFQAVSLSGAPNGGVIVVTSTDITVGVGTNPVVYGTTIHQAVAGTETWDELWLWATNGDGSSRNLTIGWGAVVGQPFVSKFAVHSQIFTTGETKAVISGLRIQNSLLVAAMGSLASAFKISGYVNRITPDE